MCGSTKALDILCVDNASLWLVEVRDYRRAGSVKPSDLPMEMARKVRDTLAGLVAAQCNGNDQREKSFARNALQCSDLKVVLHLEQPRTPSRLFPMAADPSDVQNKLKRVLKAIDPHPKVVNQYHVGGGMPWTVTG